jgi:hypothetical protein
MSHVQFQDKSGSSKRYTGVDQWCDADYNSQPPRNISPGPCLDMSIFVCEPLTRTLPPGVRAAIAVASFMFAVIVLGIVAYFVLAKASKFRRYLTLAGIRLKGAPRSGRMSLVVTDIEGYSGGLSVQQLYTTSHWLPMLLMRARDNVTRRVIRASVCRTRMLAVWQALSHVHAAAAALQTSFVALLRSCSRPWCCTTLC